MREHVTGNMRKWAGVVAAILLYYLVHEGSHVVAALGYGVFERVRILGIGVQVVANVERLSDFQVAIFCVVGSVGTLLASYLLVLLAKPITSRASKIFRAICYYATIGLLLMDPLYLTLLYRFFGGGDMNGILLFGLPELAVQAIYGAIGLVNLLVLVKYVYPLYKRSFQSPAAASCSTL